MSEEPARYGTKPAQFRLPQWAHEFLAEESATSSVTKTDVVVRALEVYKRKRFEELLAQGYEEMAEEDLAEVRAWDCTLMDGLEPEEW
ncbi:MAG: hypothetical protein WBI63_01780 [Coriobacteriia bacterium]